MSPEELARRIRRFVRFVCAAAVAIAVAAPLLLGAGYGAAMRALGGEADHKCACGMKRGTCGCPECERLERARAADGAESRMVVSSNCEKDQAPLAVAVPAVLPANAGVLAPAFVAAPLVLTGDDRDVREREKPPIPPPRRPS